MTGTKEYAAWRHMLERCYRPSAAKYPQYGGRGVTVCDSWRKSFANFFADMGRAPTSRHEVDRRDNEGNYEPGNCRWATRKEQCRNKRTNRVLDHGGHRKTMAEWAEITGFPSSIIHERITRLGWSIEEALTIPPVRGFKRGRGVRDAKSTSLPQLSEASA